MTGRVVERRLSCGGQAVVEGVLIRGERFGTVAWRTPQGEILTRTEELNPRVREEARRIPVLRGMLLLWETMQLGVRALAFSSRVADGRDPDAVVSRAATFLAIGFSVTVSALLFFVGPLMLTGWLEPRIGHAATVMLVSIVTFALLGPQPLWSELVSRLLLIPVIAGLAYEVLRATAEHADHRLVRLLTRPNLELQSLTTREPTDDQIELAIFALRYVLELDGVPEPVSTAAPATVPVVAE